MMQDARIVTVALEGLENILRHGQTDKSNGQNGYAETIEDCDGLTKIEELQVIVVGHSIISYDRHHIILFLSSIVT